MAVALLANLCVPALHAQSVQFTDGTVVLATVEQADGDGLRVRRLDNGGVLDLHWDHLSPASATYWKRQFDLIGDGQDEVMTRATEVEFLRGGTRQSLVGRIVDPNADPLVVQVKGLANPVPRSELRAVRTVEVPATQVLTKEEFYVQRLAELSPGGSADRHILLAEELIKFRDYERAGEHLDRARTLGNTRDPQKLEAAVQRLQKFQAAQKELGVLEAIQAARSRGKIADFAKGRELIARFEREFPQGRLRTEFEREKKRFEAARTRTLTQQVADQWRKSIQVLVEKRLVSDGLGLQAARDWAENRLTEEIVERLVGLLRLDADEIRALWAQRAGTPVGKRSEHFSYGVGSWVLGDQAILKDTAVGKAADRQGRSQESAETDREMERVRRLLQEAWQRRRQSVQGSGGEGKVQTDEGWWRSANRVERSNWLRAYYAEYGGQLVVTFATVTACVACFGEGSTPELAGDGKMVRAKCFLCQGTKWVRSLKAY